MDVEEAVVEEATIEHLVQVHCRRELHNKKWRIFLGFLRQNTPGVSPDNAREQNSRIIAQKNLIRFQNRRIKEREKELSNIIRENRT